jgi:hypothetical protein
MMADTDKEECISVSVETCCSHFEISSRTHYYVAILLSGRIDSCLGKLSTLKQSCLIRL